MKKREFIRFFAVLIIGFIFLLGLTSFASAASYCPNPSATPCADLVAYIDGDCTANIELSCDVVCESSAIGSAGACSGGYSGTFDGQSHTITGLIIDSSGTTQVGLFRHAASGSAVKNLGLVNANVTGNHWTGALVGYTEGITITNCYSGGIVRGNGQGTGGLIGYIDINQDYIYDSRSSANVSCGSAQCGGLIGSAHSAVINNSYATGTVTSTGQDAGGLIGRTTSSSNYVLNSFATGDVSNSNNNLGGLIGWAESTLVDGSFATGTVTSSGEYAGGLIGNTQPDVVVNRSFANGFVKGGNYVGGLIGGSWGLINNSFATGDVNATTAFGRAGGLMGEMGGNVYSSYATGHVSSDTGNGWMGGLVGSTTGGTIYNLFSTSSVDAGMFVGGLVGDKGGTIANCYWNNHSTNPDSCYNGGDTGCTAIDNNEAYFKGSVSASAPMNLWDFTNIWIENATDYPNLRNMPSEIVTSSTGSLNVSLVGMANATVNKDSSFTFNSNVSCIGGTCGNVSAYLDPAALFETKDKQLNDISETKVVNNSTRIIVVVLLIVAFVAVLLIAPSNKKMVFGLIFAIILVASVSLTFRLTGHVSYNLVSTTVGDTPFYTTSLNPSECGVLASGDSCSNSWTVIASGSAATYEFFVKYNSTTAGVGEKNSSSVFITINVPAAAATTTTTTSSGGGGRAAQIYELSDDDFKKGYRHEVYVNDVLRFNFMGGVHTIKIISVRGGEIRFVVASEPIIVDLKIGETKAIDIDGNGENDMNVELISAERGAADIVLKSIVIEQPLPGEAINESIPFPVQMSEKNKISLIWIIVVLAAIIVLVAVSRVLIKRIKFRKIS